MTTPVLIDNPPRAVELTGLTRRDRSRAACYASVVGQLLEGRITPADFRKRISRWSSISGHQLLADPLADWLFWSSGELGNLSPPTVTTRGR